MTFDQAEFDIRCEWARPGLLAAGVVSDVVVIVDVLSFTTAVDIAVTRHRLLAFTRWRRFPQVAV